MDNGVKTLVVQPTHLMNGLEYEEMSKAIAQYPMPSRRFPSASLC